MRLSAPSDRLKRRTVSFMTWIGFVVSILILAIMVLGITSLIFDIVNHGGFHTEADALLDFMDRVLLVLIAMELFRTVMAYITKEKVVLAVLEASLVAVAREIILIGKEADPMKTVSMAFLLFAVFISYLIAYNKMKGWEREALYG